MSDHDTHRMETVGGSESLSPRGDARKAEILHMLHRAAAARRVRQRTIRRGAAVMFAIAAGAVVFRWAGPATTNAPMVAPMGELAGSDRGGPIAADGSVVTPPGIPEEDPSKPQIQIADKRPKLPPDDRTPSITVVTNASVTIAECNATAPGPGTAQTAPNVCLLSDDQLLAALAETGARYGLVRTAERVEAVRNTP